ncbi:FAD-binding protein [Alkalibacter rhizosphaerae]|uniref:FAD-binding protein n=2 Tax=Alkalibacter rhizosphaerae TaxID=2815577 RepID=A0A975AIM8_9FIRM|nr:FAD-binding protein [Alkalibacter rhizosphaerae]
MENYQGHPVEVISVNTVVVGSGAAGFNAADTLFQSGQKDVVLVTEHIKAGTSRNTGSDKQTYYKLSLSGDTADSVQDLAEVLFQGQCVDGDLALCEAAASAECFFKLVQLGVPFPRNKYGEYVGYKTDHDPSKRATSVGPYTSRVMTECLEKSVAKKEIPVLDKLQVIRILTQEDRVVGLLCLNLAEPDDPAKRYVAFHCKNVIYATGGPAGIYGDSAYPKGHYGATGIAFRAGVKGKNLTEWQYGLASIKPRWNVSGTYMQVLPKFVSTDQDGEDPREFLLDFFDSDHEMLSKVFLKGYQWPFDVRKIQDGSSIIDLLVYVETILKGRRVFLDFRENPRNKSNKRDGSIDYEALQEEVREYLMQAGACFGTPIERLMHMNQPAVDFYRERGVDLEKEMLEIALCAQHNNGGLSIDHWWQTNVEGFFAVGEVSASHGVYRPGGSALNAGQVGSMRAARFIAANRQGEPLEMEAFLSATRKLVFEEMELAAKTKSESLDNLDEWWDRATKRMSRTGAAIRNEPLIREALQETKAELLNFSKEVHYHKENRLKKLYRLHDVLLSQYVYMSAMVDYMKDGGQSRGSALYSTDYGILPDKKLPEQFRFLLEDGSFADRIQEVVLKDGNVECSWRPVRPIPTRDDFFENVWRGYRENGNVEI